MMSREIKFRAWDKTYSLMNYKVQVGNTDYADQNYTCNSIWVDYGDIKNIGWINADDKCIDLMQYTGLKDKNGVEIYEGDIIGGYPHGTVQVKWNNDYACFECVWIEQECDEAGECYDKEISSLLANELDNCKDAWKVIGNIYQNPELL